MKRVFVFFGIVLSIALTGCAARLIAGNDRMVMVNAGSADAAGAFKFAQQECQKSGMQARLNTRPQGDRQWVFDCIK
jgi:hypothetical protein